MMRSTNMRQTQLEGKTECKSCNRQIHITSTGALRPHGPRTQRCPGNDSVLPNVHQSQDQSHNDMHARQRPIQKHDSATSITGNQHDTAEAGDDNNHVVATDTMPENNIVQLNVVHSETNAREKSTRATNFVWGSIDGERFTELVESAYAEVTKWRPSLFPIPRTNAGKQFISCLRELFAAFAERSALEPIAFKAATILPHLLLQSTCRSASTESLSTTLKKRIDQWKAGEIEELLAECRTLQIRKFSAKKQRCLTKEESLRRAFVHKMCQGQISSAVRILGDQNTGRVLDMNEKIDGKSVEEILNEKHPHPGPINSDLICDSWPGAPMFHQVIFDSIDSESIFSAAMHTKGASGPSGLDAEEWRRILTSFGRHSSDMRNAFASVARRIASQCVDADTLTAYNACRLVPLDKDPGVRPIGIGEVPRRIIGRAILACVRSDILSVAGNIQLCCGQIAGIEHAIHVLREEFQSENSEAILLVDASNAFNSLNRQIALKNISTICPSLTTALKNSYQEPCQLFAGNRTLWSLEGTTQGDPLAMAMYGIGVLPLIKKLQEMNSGLLQKWYADDLSVVGRLSELRAFWNHLNELGPGYGYFPNAIKCHLVVKCDHVTAAQTVFQDTNVQITDGHTILGSTIGSKTSCDDFLRRKMQKFDKLLTNLSKFAASAPHPSYSCLIRGILPKLNYIMRTTPNAWILSHLEGKISSTLIPAITGRQAPGDLERALLSLPVRDGGLAITDLRNCSEHFNESIRLCAPLSHDNPTQAYEEQMRVKTLIRSEKRKGAVIRAKELHSQLSEHQKYLRALASETGASSWLLSLPIERYGFSLDKTSFRDALCLRYGWQPIRLPSKCVCGSGFNVEHALSCHVGGFINLRHNSLRDLFATMLREVTHDVAVEPALEPLDNELFDYRTAITGDEARLDICASGLYGDRYHRTYLDIRVFSPFGRSNKMEPRKSYARHENEKRRQYGERAREVEHASFIPMVFCSSGGCGPAARAAIKRVAHLLSLKRNTNYSHEVTLLRTRISFSLIRSMEMCLRGHRAYKDCPNNHEIHHLSSRMVNSVTGMRT